MKNKELICIDCPFMKQSRKELIKEFLKDLEFIDTITNLSVHSSNVFIRIDEINDKWLEEIEK